MRKGSAYKQDRAVRSDVLKSSAFWLAIVASLVNLQHEAVVSGHETDFCATWSCVMCKASKCIVDPWKSFLFCETGQSEKSGGGKCWI